MKYEIEWMARGTLTIDTEGSEWTPEELQMQVDQEIGEAVDGIVKAVEDEFDDCDVEAEEPEYQVLPRRLS